MTPEAGPLPAPPKAGAHLAERLRALDERLAAASIHLVAGQDDAEAVHDLRVALRKTRTVLELGRDVLGPFRADEVRRALRGVHQATGALRDEEVLLETLAAHGAGEGAAAVWLEGRRRRERRLRRALARSLRAGALDGPRALLAALLAFRVDPRRDRRLDKLARRTVARARRGVERCRGAPLDDVARLHQLRIAYKRLRYAVDTLAPGLSPVDASLAQHAARMQGRLGDVHDLDVAIACVRRARGLPPVERARLLASLGGDRERRAAQYARDAGLDPPAATAQDEGVDSLRKISTR